MRLKSPVRSPSMNIKTPIVRAKTTLRTKEVYVPPEEDVESYSWGQMLSCWEQRDSKCFWENFMWWVDRKNSNSKYIVPFNTPWQADQQGKSGSNTRAITSDQPKLQWWGWNGKVPNPFNQDPKAIANFKCIDYPNLNYVYGRDCRTKCSKLTSGLEVVSDRDGPNMRFESAGCDGSTVWCWCNSNPLYQHI